MKKIITTLLSVSLLAGIGAVATGCGDNPPGNPVKPGPVKPVKPGPVKPGPTPNPEPPSPALKAVQDRVTKESDKRKSEDETYSKSKVSSASAEDIAKAGIETYSEIAYQAYSDALDGAKKLDKAIKAFIANPTEDTLKAARQAWIDSRPKYLETEVFRFANGPINNYTGPYGGTDLVGLNAGQIAIASSSGNDQGDDIEGFVNPWPLDENYIDYTVNPDNNSVYETTFKASLIGDETSYPLSFLQDKEKVRGRNEGDPIAGQMCPNKNAGEADVPCDDPNANKNGDGGESEKNLSTGYHAIEFMLWGQDFNDDGPGDRPVIDYTTEPKAERRKAYLNTISEILVDDLTWVVKQWEPGKTDNYRAKLKEAAESNPKDVYTLLLSAMQNLSVNETGGERVVAALQSGSQEDEHSCFSDNTPVDFIEDVQGLLNVWYGRYAANDSSKNVRGLGLKHYADKLAPEASKKLTDTLEQAEIDANLMVDKSNKKEEYFDQVIIKYPKVNPGRFRVVRFARDLYNTKDIYKSLYKTMNLTDPNVEDPAEFDE